MKKREQDPKHHVGSKDKRDDFPNGQFDFEN